MSGRRRLPRSVPAGRPTLALRVLDDGAGVDPYSLTIGYGRALVGDTLVSVGKSVDYRVTGIIKDLPKNSHFATDMIARYDPATFWAEQPDFPVVVITTSCVVSSRP